MLLVLSVVISLSAALSSCGSKGNETSEAPSAGAVAGSPVDMSTTGTITGSIKLDGNPPEMKNISMAAAQKCAEQRSAPAMTQTVVPGGNGTLQNVVVYLKGDFSRYSFPKMTTPVTIDQQGCMFNPHVLAVMIGQPLRVINSDAMGHNINAASKNSPRQNESQPAGSTPKDMSFAHEEIAISVKCNIHPWMKAYIAVVGTPYFQVTGQDGSFELKNVPPGTYTLTAWHETYGTSEQSVTIGPKEEKAVNITIKAAAGSY